MQQENACMTATWLLAQGSMAVFGLVYTVLHFACTVPGDQQRKGHRAEQGRRQTRHGATNKKHREPLAGDFMV